MIHHRVLYYLLNDLFDKQLKLSSEEVLSKVGVVKQTLVPLNFTFVDLKSSEEDLNKIFLFIFI